MGGALAARTRCESCGNDARCDGLEACTRCLPGRYGFTYRQLDYWCRRGFLRPPPVPGSGHNREWTAGELLIAGRIARLTAAGVVLPVAARLARDGRLLSEIAPGVYVWIWEGP